MASVVANGLCFRAKKAYDRATPEQLTGFRAEKAFPFRSGGRENKDSSSINFSDQSLLVFAPQPNLRVTLFVDLLKRL